MDKLSHSDSDVEHVIRFCGISDFRYRDFRGAMTRPIKPLAISTDMLQEKQQKIISDQDKNIMAIPAKENLTYLSKVFKTLCLD